MITGIIILVSAAAYIPVYIWTRRDFTLEKTAVRYLKEKIVLCSGVTILMLMIPLKKQGVMISLPFLCILVFLSDIDIIIRKIPAEILAVICCLIFPEIFRSGNFYCLLFLPASFVFWGLIKKRTGLGLYDIILIAVLSVSFDNLQPVLIFYSLIMTAWGLAGLILLKIFGKTSETKIPLVPIIITAFLLSQIIR